MGLGLRPTNRAATWLALVAGVLVGGCGSTGNPKLLSPSEYEKVSHAYLVLLERPIHCAPEAPPVFDKSTFESVSTLIDAFRKHPTSLLGPQIPAHITGSKAKEAEVATRSPTLRAVLYQAVESVTKCGETEEAHRLRDVLTTR
jgi:hypothetical protein